MSPAPPAPPPRLPPPGPPCPDRHDFLRQVVGVFGPDESAGIVSFAVEGVHAHDVGTILDESHVAIRAGHHCAQPLMAHLGVDATARASFGVYNGRQDVEALIDGIGRVQRSFG